MPDRDKWRAIKYSADIQLAMGNSLNYNEDILGISAKLFNTKLQCTYKRIIFPVFSCQSCVLADFNSVVAML